MSDFRRSILKLNETRVHKLSNSYGMNDYYKYLVKNEFFGGTPLSQKLITEIIRLAHSLIADLLTTGKDFDLPERMGRFEVRKRHTNVDIVDGQVKEDYPIDWGATLKLWEEDEYSRNNKVLVKKITLEIYRIFHNKNGGVFKNKSFMQFFPAKSLKRKLKENIENGNTEAFLIREE